MAEVSGIPPTDPSKHNKTSPVNALTGSIEILQILEESLEVQTQILDAVKSSMPNTLNASHASQANATISALNSNTESLLRSNDTFLDVKNSVIDNTGMLKSLQETIQNATVDVTMNGESSTFFSQLVNVAGDKNKTLGLETFSKIYEQSVLRMARLEKFAGAIDTTAQSLFGAFSTFKEFGKGLMFFSGGLALLGFTIVTFMEAVTWDDILSFGAIMLVLRGAAELVGKGSWDLAKVSVGIATLGLAVWGFTELIDTKMGLEFMKSIGLVSVGVGILAGVGRLLNAKTNANLLRGSLSVAAMSGSVWLLNKAVSDFDEVDLEKALNMGIITAGLGVVWAAMGSQLSLIGQGALASAGIGLSLMLLTEGIIRMSEIDISLERGLELAAIMVGAAGVFALIGNPITIGFIGMGIAAASGIGLALFALSAGMNSIGSVNVTLDQAKNYGASLERTVDALSYLGNPLNIISLPLAVPAALAITGATLGVYTAMIMINKMPIIDTTKYDNFGLALESLVDTYSGIGAWGLIKATAASGVVMMLSGATVVAAGAINLFTKLSANPDAVDNAVLSLDNFVTGVADSLDKNSSKFKSIGSGISSFMGLSSMVGEIAQSVQAISNLEFYEKTFVNGKVVVTDVRSFTPDDFKRVGESIGSILFALTDPLAQMGSQKDSFSIGGFSITNPFSNKVKKGVDSMMNIGSIFTPLTGLLQVFASEGISSTYIKTFNTDLSSLLTGIGSAFSKDGIQIDNKIVKLLGSATESVNNMLYHTMNKKFDKGVGNFSTFSADLTAVKKSMNDIDLSKLSKFNTMLYNLNELKKSDAISELLKVFTEFIEKLTEFETKRVQPQIVQTQNSQTQQVQQSTRQQLVPNNTSPEQFKEYLIDANDEIVSAIQQMYELFASGQVQVNVRNKQNF